MKKTVLSLLLLFCVGLTMLPTGAMAATNYRKQPQEGWFYLRCMNNYLNIDANGNAELRNKSNTPEGNMRYRLHYYGTGGYGFEMPDGRYLGLEITDKAATTEYFNNTKYNGLRVKALPADFKKYMLRWDIYSQNNADIFNIRPRMNVDILLNASGQKRVDGTPIITWMHLDRERCPAYPTPEAPEHGQIRFIPTHDPSLPGPGTPKTPQNGWVRLRIQGLSFSINAQGKAELGASNMNTRSRTSLYVENRGNHQVTLRMIDGRFIGISGTPANGTVATASNTPYLWNVYTENTGVEGTDYYSLRPSGNTELMLNASGEGKKVGTPLILWKHKSMDAPKHGTFEFYKIETPDNAVTKPVEVPPNAIPTASTVYVNGKAQAFEAYTINGNNYFKLRDLAMVLSGTQKQFEVGYDAGSKSIFLTSNQPYTAVGGELVRGDGTGKNAARNQIKISLDGKPLDLTAYLIKGNNFLKLRDLMKALDVSVGYDDVSKAISLDTSRGYID